MTNAEKYHAAAVKDVITEMENQGFSHICVVEEGFEILHEIAIKFNLSLQSHKESECYYCSLLSGENNGGQGWFGSF